MRMLGISTLYFSVCLSNVPFSIGLFESQNTLLKPLGRQLRDIQNAEKRQRENSKFGVFSNPFGNKQEESNRKSIKRKLPTDLDIPETSKHSDLPFATRRSKADGVRRKFRSRKPSWMSSMLGNRRQGMNDAKDKNPSRKVGSHLNPFANPSEKQDFLPLTTEGTPNIAEQTNVNPKAAEQEADVNTKPILQETDVRVNTKPSVQETDVGKGQEENQASSKYEFGGESHLVPCQWGGCFDGFHCMRLEKGRAIDCQEDTTEFCQCMREKSRGKTQGQAEAESSSLKISVPTTEGGGALPYNIPQDMEVGGESLAGVPCQYTGCLENFQCMTIEKGQLIVCDADSMDICQCMRKKSSISSHNIADVKTTTIPSTEVPLVMGTDSVIPCQFWGCESGFQCLLVINGQKRACPSNSNAVCQCVRHVVG